MDHEYRFFNFLYACTIYNVWLLADLLVKLELLAEAEFRHNLPDDCGPVPDDCERLRRA